MARMDFARGTALVGGSGLLLGAGALAYVIRQMSKPPANTPARFLREGPHPPGERVVVVLGASIVQGRVGVSFVERLARRFPAPGYRFVNAGVNGDTAYHVQQRLDPVVSCDPDVVVILVGNNDVIGTLSPAAARRYIGAKRLPSLPNLAAYRETMRAIVHRLQSETHTHLALCSLPLLGEDLSAPANETIRAFNAALQEVATEAGIAYLPVYETESAWLAAEQQKRGKPGRPYTGDSTASLRLGFLAAVQHYLLRRSFDAISRANGLLLKTDLIHSNTQEATIIADQIAAFLTTLDTPPANVEESATQPAVLTS